MASVPLVRQAALLPLPHQPPIILRQQSPYRDFRLFESTRLSQLLRFRAMSASRSSSLAQVAPRRGSRVKFCGFFGGSAGIAGAAAIDWRMDTFSSSSRWAISSSSLKLSCTVIFYPNFQRQYAHSVICAPPMACSWSFQQVRQEFLLLQYISTL